jgi:voltage-gated potassium channel
MKKRIFNVLEMTNADDIAARVFTISMTILISLNVLMVVLESVESIHETWRPFFTWAEVISVAIFTMEYLARLWTCTSNPRYRGALAGRIRFVLSPLALVDLFAILPFYLPFLISADLRFIRALRLFRLFRIFKLGRYTDALRTLGRVLRAKREELFISLFLVVILLLLTSSLMYYFENAAQPDAFSSIPVSMWWGVATLTTVGYGDVYPITPWGRFLGAIVSILGIGLFALPAGILASGFASEIRSTRGIKCPYCGEPKAQ